MNSYHLIEIQRFTHLQPLQMNILLRILFDQYQLFQQLYISAMEIRESQSGLRLYEQVLSQNFEIIQSFLAKFHSVFSKQDEVDEILSKIEKRMLALQKKSDRMSMDILNSQQIFENKFNTLKQFCGQKFPKVQESPSTQLDKDIQHQNDQAARLAAEAMENIFANSSHFNELRQNYKNLESSVLSNQNKLNSIHNLTVCLQSKVKTLMRSEQSREINYKKVLFESNQKYDKILNELKSEVIAEISQIKENMNHDHQCIMKNATISINSFSKMQQEVDNKVNIAVFRELQSLCNQNQQTMIMGVEQTFARKSQIQSYINYFNKKLEKLQLETQIGQSKLETTHFENKSPSSNKFKVRSSSSHNSKAFGDYLKQFAEGKSQIRKHKKR